MDETIALEQYFAEYIESMERQYEAEKEEALLKQQEEENKIHLGGE